MLDFHSDLDLVSFLPDPLDELAFRAAVRFCKVTGDPRPWPKILDHAGYAVTVRDTMCPEWRKKAAAALHPNCTDSTIKRMLSGPLDSLVFFVLGQRKQPGVDNPGKVWLTPEQVDDLFCVASEPEKHGLIDPYRRVLNTIAFLVGTGCRTGEAFAMSVEDIDWDNGECFVRAELPGAGKTGASRRFTYLPEKSAAMMTNLPTEGRLLRYRSGRDVPLRYKGGGQFSKEFELLRRAAELPACTPRDLRHTWATWTYASTKDILLLMSLGGWTKHDTAFRYAKLAPSNLSRRLHERGWRLGRRTDR